MYRCTHTHYTRGTYTDTQTLAQTHRQASWIGDVWWRTLLLWPKYQINSSRERHLGRATEMPEAGQSCLRFTLGALPAAFLQFTSVKVMQRVETTKREVSEMEGEKGERGIPGGWTSPRRGRVCTLVCLVFRHHCKQCFFTLMGTEMGDIWSSIPPHTPHITSMLTRLLGTLEKIPEDFGTLRSSGSWRKKMSLHFNVFLSLLIETL